MGSLDDGGIDLDERVAGLFVQVIELLQRHMLIAEEEEEKKEKTGWKEKAKLKAEEKTTHANEADPEPQSH